MHIYEKKYFIYKISNQLSTMHNTIHILTSVHYHMDVSI